jgi:peptidoglycan/LPS O-acetylase OafA/YrhL
VEGLRGVAVLAVVLYHADLGAVRGGYVGVDVFFVLSGFLITGLLWEEIGRTGRILFASFYARRARRLLPAAVLVLMVTVAAAAFWLPPLHGRAVTSDALASALYVANYRFAVLRTDYLTSEAAPSPLQHYWSLGVEEQFYVFWPLLLLAASLAWRRGRTPSLAGACVALGIIGVTSLSLSLWLTEAAQPWAFFSLPTRAWELTAGGLVALGAPLLRRLPAAVAAALGWSGFAAVIWSAAGFDSTTPFPGTAALVPVGGTAALLAAGSAAPRLGPDVVLRRRPLQLAGKLSYSWYLWHWPVLILVPAALGHPLPSWQRFALAGGSGLLALVTVRAVEDPVRFAPRLRSRPGWSFAVAAALTAAAVSSAVAAAGTIPVPRGPGAAAAAIQLPALPARPAAATTTPAAARLAAIQASVAGAVADAVMVREVPSNLDPALEHAHADKARPYLDGCHHTFTETRLHPCVYGVPRSSTSLVLFGDSHAVHWFPALDRLARTRGWRLLSLTKSTCPPIVLSLWSPVLGRPYRECDQWRAGVLRRIRAERPAVVVLGSARHYGPEYRFRIGGPEWTAGLRAMVSRIRATGAKVGVVGPVPRPKGDVPDCLSRHLRDAVACTQPLARAVDQAGLRSERATVLAAGGIYLNVAPWICTRTTCAVILSNLLLYRDDNHLSTAYSAWLAPVVGAALDQALPSRLRTTRPRHGPG